MSVGRHNTLARRRRRRRRRRRKVYSGADAVNEDSRARPRCERRRERLTSKALNTAS